MVYFIIFWNGCVIVYVKKFKKLKELCIKMCFLLLLLILGELFVLGFLLFCILRIEKI